MSDIGFDQGLTDKNTQEARFNLFKFQDYLVYKLMEYSMSFQEGDYSLAFDILQEIYLGCIGMLDGDDVVIIDEKWNTARQEYNNVREYLSQIANTPPNKRKYLNLPLNIYNALINFKRPLMMAMARKQLLIQMRRTGIMGAAES